MIREGATVYIYDPPAKRRGLSRRIQDNVSWEGPGTVVCVEREKTVPSKIWVRLKGRVKAVPLEKVRLATVEELVSGHFIKEALDEVQKELTSGRMRAEEIPAGDVAEEDRQEVEEKNVLEDGTESDTSEDSRQPQPDDEEDLGKDMETERMRLEKRLLTDVPLSMRPVKHGGEAASSSEAMLDPSKMPFAKKQRLFENLAKELGAPSPMQEARLRGELEDAFSRLKSVRKSLKIARPKPKAEPVKVQRRRAVTAVRNQGMEVMVALELRRREAEGDDHVEAELQRGECREGPEDHEQYSQEPFNAFSWKEIPRKTELVDARGTHDLGRILREMEQEDAEYGHEVTEVLFQDVLWTQPSPQAVEAMVLQRTTDRGCEEEKVLDASQLITGKDRVEFNWKQLEEGWKKAFIQPILKAFKVYFDHDAIQGVPLGQWVEPQRILPSRLVLTNEEKELPDAGKYYLLNAIAVQKQWKVCYEDVSAALLQGQKLPEEREIYVKVPVGYPEEALQGLKEMIGPNARHDVVRLVKREVLAFQRAPDCGTWSTSRHCSL